MLQIIKDTHFDFIRFRKSAFLLSMGLILAGLVSLGAHKGLRMGVEFTGGVQVEIGIDIEETVDIARVRNAVQKAGFDSRNIQRVGGVTANDFLISVQGVSEDNAEGNGAGSGDAAGEKQQTTSQQILKSVREEFGSTAVDLRGVEAVGPRIGGELRLAALQAVLLSLLLVMIYVAWRFEFRFGVATLVAVLHDVLVVVGLFSLFNKEMTLSIVAALLTLVGYSVNDTIVVFDRIREEVKKKQRRESVEAIFNTGINKTLSRTVLTSLTTLLVVVALFVYGGEVIHDFAWVLLVGVIVGTYSSVFVAAPLVTEWQKRAAIREAQRAA